MTTLIDYPYGVYHAGHQTFINKSDALFYASKNNLDVRWNFHESTYKSVDWTVRPSKHIQELYRERAQQIRDTYDYVIVQFSGGADSWTVLDSFLSNGIRVDEIYTRWSFKEGDYKTANAQDRREYNLYSEYHYAVRPILDELAKTHPDINIYIDDDTEEYHQQLNEKNFVDNGGHYLCIGTFHRFARKSPQERQAVRQGLKVGVVHGFDKLQCQVADGKFYAYFADKCGGTAMDPERSVEFFYWSPNFSQIPILAGHMLREFYLTQLDKIVKDEDYLRQSYISVCYPSYNLNTFQVRKPAGSELWASKLWLHQYSPGYIESWKWHVDQYTKSIDTRFCNVYGEKLRLGYQLCKSPLYYIGPFNSALNFDFTH
jgi:hypothetical protein